MSLCKCLLFSRGWSGNKIKPPTTGVASPLFFSATIFPSWTIKEKRAFLRKKTLEHRAELGPTHFFLLSHWEVRLFHVHVYQVIFKTCLVLLRLFYFNQRKAPGGVCIHIHCKHPGCSMVHITTITRCRRQPSPARHKASGASQKQFNG